MITVGIRNLKDSLSQYLKMVKSGERIVITDHNRIIAEIVPASGEDKKADLLASYLKELTRSGKMSPATKKTSLGRERTGDAHVDQKQIDNIYEQSRSERL